MISKRGIHIISVLVFSILSIYKSDASEIVKIGIYDNPPKIFRDEKDEISGFIADITRSIMDKAGLDYRFVYGTWLEGLNRLQTGEIDVMVDVAFSDERAELYSFNNETVFVNWGVVYVKEGVEIDSFIDLDGMVVAGMKGGIHSEGQGGVLNLAKQFNINIVFLPVEDYEQAFLSVEEGMADAAVVNRIFGLEQEGRRQIKRTSIFFNPISIKYAFNKESDQTAALIDAFDSALSELKSDKNSVFYTSMARYLPGFVEHSSFIPVWLKIVLPSIIIVLIFACLFIWVLKEEIRHRRILEKELVKAKEEAEAANRAKTVFLSNTSHEIRTPMNAVLGYAQILYSDESLKEEQRNYAARIMNGGEHLLSIINEILEMSRIEAGRVKIETEPFDLLTALKNVEILVKERAEKKGLILSFSIEKDVPVRILGDDKKVRQILLNLIGNAIKFTEEGTVKVCVTKEEGKDLLKFLVSDTGRGMDQEDLKRIFVPFEQVKSEDYSREGTGLGLPISLNLARLLGGDISVSSEPGKGSAFLLTLPLCPAEGSAESPVKKETAKPFRRMRLKQGKTVLIADDNEANRTLLKTMLEPCGFSVIEAVNGREAYEIYTNQRPPVLMIDLVMPGSGGLEAVKKIRKFERDNSLPRAFILVITASVLEDEKPRVIEAGADYFFKKPFSFPDILDCLSSSLEFEFLDNNGAAGDKEETPPESWEARRAIKDLMDMEEPWRRAFHKALDLGDVEALIALDHGISELKPDLSAVIKQAVKTYKFDYIIGLLFSKGGLNGHTE